MIEKSERRTVTINNEAGFHARPADLFVRLAMRFSASIEITKDNQTVDGKSILGILTLAATKGTKLEIGAHGDDAKQAIDALVELIDSGFAEDEKVQMS